MVWKVQIEQKLLKEKLKELRRLFVFRVHEIPLDELRACPTFLFAFLEFNPWTLKEVNLLKSIDILIVLIYFFLTI